MKKKWWIGLLSLACLAVGGLGLVACGDNSAQKGDEPTQIQAVYAQYVAHAEEKGQEPLSYEEWLATIKGEKGDQGVGIKTVEFDKDGNLLITFTDGTTQTVEMPKKDGVTQTVESLQYQRISGKDEYRVIGLGNVSELDIVIPDTYKGLPVTEIGEKAFYNINDAHLSYIKSVEIGDSVTTIGFSAFYGCSSLTSVVIPDSVTSIGDGTFYDCSSLTSVVIPDSVTSIGGYAFYNCSSLTEIVIPDSVTSIGGYAFYNCSSLTSVVIPDSVTSIGGYAFRYCNSLTSVYITDVAAWCKISFGDSYANPLWYAKNLYLNNELVTELIIPDSVTSIGYSAFYNYSSLTSVVIPDGVTSIGDYAFCYCSSLTSVEIPDSVTTIASSAFYGCSSLTSVVIPDGVTSIGGYAFHYCDNLTIYCEAERQPEGWYPIWNSSDCPVVWGYKGE